MDLTNVWWALNKSTSFKMSFGVLYEQLVSDIDYHETEEFLLKYLNKEKNVLDVGCGTGIFSIFLKQHGFNVTGIDKDTEMLSIFEQKQRDLGIFVPIFEHDIKDLLGTKFDQMILLNDVINYFKGIKGISKRLYHGLEDDGLILIDLYKEEYLNVMDGYVEEDDEPINYVWKTTVKNFILTHEIKTFGARYKFNQYIYKLDYYISTLTEVGFKVEVVSGPDERKHYFKLTK